MAGPVLAEATGTQAGAERQAEALAKAFTLRQADLELDHRAELSAVFVQRLPFPQGLLLGHKGRGAAVGHLNLLWLHLWV